MKKLVILLKRKKGLTREECLNYRRDIHAPLLLSIPESKKYIRKFIVSTPIEMKDHPESPFDFIVEAWFDSLNDLNSLFKSENFLNVVDPDHENFLDTENITRIITEETTVV